MALIYVLTGFFSLLTVFFTYEEYKKCSISKKSFILISFLECIVCVFSIILALAIWETM